MLNLIATLAVITLSTPLQQSPRCEAVTIYFESERAVLSAQNAQFVDSVFAQVRSTHGPRVTATITGHTDSDEQARGLTSLDEERAAAVRNRLRALLTGQSDQWSFTIRGVNNTEPAHPSSRREPLNRRAELSVCPGSN